jgi:hypothetical protein
MIFKAIFIIFMISRTNSISVFNNKRINEADILMFVYESTIINVSLKTDYNFEINKKHQYTVAVNQIINFTNKSLKEDEIIQNSAKLAAKGCALIINTSGKEDLENTIATVIYLSVNLNKSEEIENYKSFLFLISFDRPLNVNIKKTIKSEKFNKNSTSATYDFHGAKMYIWVIISIYSTFVLLLLILRVKPILKGGTENTDRVKGEKFLRSMHENTHTRRILEQLRNEAYRKKA